MSETETPCLYGPMRRKDRQIDDHAEIAAILDGEKVMHLALADNEAPYVVPLNYGYDGKAIYFHSAPAGTKLEILKRNNCVCFEVLGDYELMESENACDYSARFRSVIGAGRACFVTDFSEKVRALDLIMAKVSDRTFDYPPSMVAKTAIVRIDIESIKGKKKGY